MVRLTVITPTIGRPTLKRTLESVEAAGLRKDEELIVIGDGPRPAARQIVREHRSTRDVIYYETRHMQTSGHHQRNSAMEIASGTHLSFMDDDDAYRPGALNLMREVAEANPGRIAIFRMKRNPPRFDGGTLWHYRDVFLGNVGTPMMLIPNVPEQLGVWAYRAAGDYDFLQSTLARWPGGKDGIVWREEVVCDVY